jgi:hypothetical protein
MRAGVVKMTSHDGRTRPMPIFLVSSAAEADAAYVVVMRQVVLRGVLQLTPGDERAAMSRVAVKFHDAERDDAGLVCACDAPRPTRPRAG